MNSFYLSTIIITDIFLVVCVATYLFITFILILLFCLKFLGWILVAVVSFAVFLVMCGKRCCSPLGYQQEAYWSTYRASEQTLFQRTAEAHAKLRAAENIRTFFGFVALEEQEKGLVTSCQGARQAISNMEWNQITGVYLYRENEGIPLYSRLNKWASFTIGNNTEAIEMDMLG